MFSLDEDIFGDKNKSPKARETTPDYFAEVEQPSQMSLFSPSKPDPVRLRSDCICKMILSCKLVLKCSKSLITCCQFVQQEADDIWYLRS